VLRRPAADRRGAVGVGVQPELESPTPQRAAGDHTVVPRVRPDPGPRLRPLFATPCVHAIFGVGPRRFQCGSAVSITASSQCSDVGAPTLPWRRCRRNIVVAAEIFGPPDRYRVDRARDSWPGFGAFLLDLVDRETTESGQRRPPCRVVDGLPPPLPAITPVVGVDHQDRDDRWALARGQRMAVKRLVTRGGSMKGDRPLGAVEVTDTC